ncbi:cytochrome P450 [Paenibacillus bouchesdurhonensis]|uniref:cytochrome P450 n=1 Tax=Paenibacillus bouchesdurhonensis TaxID=1870990 RepID=UPI000DA619C1|nr:cytochrome P450 [Paenibacillus bouchesdurhonensis]
MKEIIPVAEITKFRSNVEEFNPYSWYKQKLLHEPISYHKETNTWNVFKYDDVKRVLSDYEYFSSERKRTIIDVGADAPEGAEVGKIDIIGVDPPEHRKRRALLSSAFTPRSLKLWEPRIHKIVEELIDEIPQGSPIDITGSLTAPLPIIVMSELLGVPSENRELFKQWVDILFMPSSQDNRAAVNELKNKAAREYYSFLLPLIVAKRSNLEDDIISDLIQVDVDGERFSDDEIVRTSMFILGAGIETTSHLLANTFYAFLYDNDKIYGELRNEPHLIPNTIEEMLRYRFHISKMDRTVRQDNAVLGVELKKGDVVVAWMSAANMDEAMFEKPFDLDIRRHNSKKHLTFGIGPHFCLGAPLARLEATIMLEHFVQRFSRIEPVAEFHLEEHLQPAATGQSLVYLPLVAYT